MPGRAGDEGTGVVEMLFRVVAAQPLVELCSVWKPSTARGPVQR
jgi:hypothetical protein